MRVPEMRHPAAFGKQQPQRADHGGFGEAFMQMIRDALGQGLHRVGAVDDSRDIEGRGREMAFEQRLE
ncbi:hypothetical protein CTI14_50160, partial [Methylobacterium radiotolerans]